MKHVVFTALAVVALLLGGLAAPSEAGNIRFGRIWAADKVLREGCHGYRYQYVVRPGNGNWLFETFLHGPSGRTIASNAIDSSVSRKRDASHFRVCNDVTRPGRFKITGKLSWQTCTGMPGPLNQCTRHVHWVKPGYFRMRRP